MNFANLRSVWVILQVLLQKISAKDNNKIKRKSNVGDMVSNFFKWKHLVGEIILLNVRWYLIPIELCELEISLGNFAGSVAKNIC
jgi:hypothetical protein